MYTLHAEHNQLLWARHPILLLHGSKAPPGASFLAQLVTSWRVFCFTDPHHSASSYCSVYWSSKCILQPRLAGTSYFRFSQGHLPCLPQADLSHSPCWPYFCCQILEHVSYVSFITRAVRFQTFQVFWCRDYCLN